MSHDLRFALKIHPQTAKFQLPESERRYRFSTNTFCFFATQSVGFALREEGDGAVRLQIGDLALRGFTLCWAPETCTLNVETDALSLAPLFAMPASDGGLWLSNVSYYFALLEPGYRLNSLAVNSLFARSYLLPDQLLIEGARRISGSWQWTFGQDFAPPSANWSLQQIECSQPNLSDVLSTTQTLQASLDAIFASAQPEEFRMSGGADSRLIACLLRDEQRERMTVRLMYSPWVGKEQDQDYQVAKRWCDRFGWKYVDEAVDDSHSAFFRRSGEVRLLSGLYGGEFLGGCWIKMLPTQLETPDPTLTLSKDGEEEFCDSHSQLMQATAADRRLRAKQVLTHSERSTICGNVRSGWCSPVSNFRVAMSPFAVLPFMQHVLGLPESELADYRYFTDVLEHIEGDRHFPICSQLVGLHPRWQAPSDWGLEPKGLRPARQAPAGEFDRVGAAVLRRLERRGVRVDLERFAANCRSSYAFVRQCYSFYYGLPERSDREV